jgi:hypothetical protein
MNLVDFTGGQSHGMAQNREPESGIKPERLFEKILERSNMLRALDRVGK